MSKDINHLSEQELAEMIANAQRALAHKESARKKEVLAQIKQLADSIGVTAVIKEAGEAKSALQGKKVAVKYRNPHNSSEQWTGRGVKPKWLVRLLNEGRSIEEFLI